ncbi:MAG: hypothetical protein UV68_C0020G0021 [Candidatus Collierbacteria bacterium GW2011_GWC2_43_12]|uniref:Uncharacterized protein n=1 Tax=Candidatus Collierbacteria bacterium GW2011_GWC2_43_12 TaxID=1618390 RepID=A0A0G1FEF8_9BACT|nr:MAG: hypothetical protein UV68_C0020G0021 [Candidatus Collierbacteria bacterium GW2011_GWC2_43_12]
MFLMILTSAYVVFISMIGRGIYKNQGDALTITLLMLLFLGSTLAFLLYAISVIPGIATILGILFILIVSFNLGACCNKN